MSWLRSTASANKIHKLIHCHICSMILILCDDSMRFGRRIARKLFPELNIERWDDIFGIPKD